MNAQPTSPGVGRSVARAAEVMAEGRLKFLPLVDAESHPVVLRGSGDFVRPPLER